MENRFKYPATRHEGAKPEEYDIAHLHGISFIRDVIPAILARKNTVAVLDAGAGACIYAEQLRKEFGDRIRVITTGDDREAAKSTRSSWQEDNTVQFIRPQSKRRGWLPEYDLHPQDDLVSKSISDVDPNLHFDIIMDTCGEIMYGIQNLDDFRNYIAIVIAKLNSEGMASLVGLQYNVSENGLSDMDADQIRSELELLAKQYHFQIEELIDMGSGRLRIRIVKAALK